MKLWQSLIAHRLNVSFLLLLLLMASCIPFALLDKIHLVTLPITVSLVLIFWLIYSSFAKKNLIKQKLIKENHSDIVEDLDKAFVPDSKLKKLFAALGLSGANIVVITVICVKINSEVLDKYAFSLWFYLIFGIVYAISYTIIKKLMK